MSGRAAVSCAIPPLAAGVIALAAMAAHAAEPLAGGDEAGVTAAAVAGKSRAMTAMALAGQPRVADAEGAMAGGAAPIEVESREAASSARWTSSAELVGRSYRWSLSRGALDLGLRFDTPRSATPAANLGTPPSPAGAELPATSFCGRVSWADNAPSAGTLLERAMASAKGES